MEEEQKIVDEFMSFTGTEDQEKATSFLRAADWNLPDAVQLFFAEQTTVDSEPTAEEDEGIRAPIPSKFERIIDQPTVYEQRARERETQTPIYEAFRNHSAELAEYQNGPDAKGGTTGLAKLYKAPIDLLFRGTFEEAKESAMKQNLWLMVNVQSAEEFASHQLNCDTFSNEALKEMIKANFVFFQTYTTGVTGERLTVMYGIQQCPCILIIDPITGGLMRSNYGFIEAERLIEHLIHYMDFTPEDESGAKQLQSQKHRKSKTKDETRAVSSPVLTKEMQSALAEALEDSKKRKSGKSAQPEVSRSGGEGSSQVLQESSPIDHKHRFTTNLHDQDNIADKESKQRQPVASPIPDTNAEDTCVVCILLPNGQRAKRAFHKTDKIESLYGFCNAEFPEAMEKPYKLVPRIPGSMPVEDWEMSIESAGIAGSVLALIWD